MKNNPSEEWILPYLSNSLSQEEKSLFYAWLNEAEENKQLYFEIKLVYDAANSNEKSIDVNKSWERLLAKRHPRRFNLSKGIKQTISYAAVAIIGVLLSTLYFTLYTGKFSGQPEMSFVSGNGLKADLVILPDGTRVNLGKATTLKTTPYYGINNRTIYLDGEAFFDVVKQESNPFIVKVENQEIEVLGTKFNVMAYASDSIFVVTLLEGAVKSTIESTSVVDFLAPNQQLVYNRNSQLSSLTNVEAEQYASWKEGYSFFEEQSLSFILNRLSLTYGVSFDIMSPSLDEKRFTGTFYLGQSLNDVLDVLSVSVPLNYRVEGRRVEITE